MKIAIITFHGSHNYGSVLQAYATSTYLRGLGYDVEIINLRSQAQKDAYRIYTRRRFSVRQFVDVCFTTLTYGQRKRRFDNFEYFINHILPVTKKEYATGTELHDSELDYDIYVTGSDQVWNPECPDFDTAYYLAFTTASQKRIAYAPSLGKSSFDYDDKELIRHLLQNIDYISCREKQGCEILRSLTDNPVTHVCDPVVLLDKHNWDEFAVAPKIDQPYILTYFLNNNHGDRSQVDYLRKKTGYKVIALNEYLRDWLNPHIELKLDVTPQEFVGLIKHAAIVCTNSFHATAFSVIFQKQFFTAIASQTQVANNNDSRKIDFLTSLGLESRLLPNGTTPDLNAAVDYEKAQSKLNVFRTASAAFLIKALQS